MSQITFRGNLSARAFPLIAEHFGRTVIVGGQDQNFNRQVVSTEDIDRDRGIPQVYYCHNVMPTAEGLQSVGYSQQTTINAAVPDTFRFIYNDRGVSGQYTQVAHTSDGRNFIIRPGFNFWVEIAQIPGDTGAAQVTTANISGQTYYCFEGLGVYYLNTSILPYVFVNVPLIGITTANVRGITASNGYLIAWTNTYIGWSSAIAHILVTDPFDFTPSLATGAGGGQIEAAKGSINICVNHYLGFIVYTTNNAIGAMYSGNARFPFNFKEIIGAGGITDIGLISADSDAGNHYAYTSSGLQLVGMTSVAMPMSEVTDFLAGKYFEDFDDTTKTFVHTILTTPMRKAINVISDRYLVISYGVNESFAVLKLTHAIVYDLASKRFGKFKIDHVTSFEFGITQFSDPERRDAPRTSIGFMQKNGAIQTVDFTVGAASSNGTLILGKYQYIRARTITLDGIEFENVFPTSTFSISNLLSIDGKNTTTMPVTALPPIGNLRSFKARQTGINHSLLVQGNFFLSSLVLNFHMNGRR
jgi:hypothetical protein